MGLNWITKNQRERESTNSTSSGFTSPNTIDGLYAADIIISPSELSLLVRKSGSVLAQILTNKIVDELGESYVKEILDAPQTLLTQVTGVDYRFH